MQRELSFGWQWLDGSAEERAQELHIRVRCALWNVILFGGMQPGAPPNIELSSTLSIPGQENMKCDTSMLPCLLARRHTGKKATAILIQPPKRAPRILIARVTGCRGTI